MAMNDDKTTSYSVLHEIENWKLEAREEDSLRYFFSMPELSRVMTGESCYVIGRKGCGKTAIAEHIRGLANYNTFVRSLSFKNFPFNDIYQHSDSRFSEPSQYITFWKFVIYNAICTSLATNENIAANVSAALREHFDMDFDKALARSISKVTQATFGLNIVKAGATGSFSKTVIENDTPWISRVDILEDLIEKYADESDYFILFDELDEDYKDMLEPDRKSQYFNLLTSLFKAVSDIRRRYKGSRRIRPVIFLRDDIYEFFDDNDKNKWEDLAVSLTWTPSRLQDLTAFRISKALDPKGKVLGFSEALAIVFQSSTIRHGFRTRNRRHIFKHILDRTLVRPRDVICYLKESARIANQQHTDIITIEMMREADQQYSKRFRREFIDEMHSIVPYVPEIFAILSNIRKQVLAVEEFRKDYDFFKGKKPDALDFESACSFLYYFSVIGNIPSQTNTEIFNYKERSQMNFREKIVIHRGMLKSLQIR